MKSKKYLLALLPIFLFVLVLSGCGSATEKDSKNTLAINSGDVIATMDSSMNTDAIGAQHLTNTMEGLYRYDGKDLKPAIAKKVVKPTNGGKTYTFDLRHTQWSNGKPVTANDFVYAWRRTVDPKTASQYAYIYSGIKNADKINAGKKPVNTLGIKALGKYKLEVTLENAIPYFNTLMASSTFYPQYKPAVEKAGKQYGLSSTGMVFNGPFKLVNWNVSKNSWTEVKNNKYWNAKAVRLKTLKYYVVKDANTGLNLYDANRINRYEKLGGDTARQVSSYKTFSMDKQTANFYLELNQKKYKFFRNAKIRQAISMSINREQLTNNVLGKTGGIEHTIVPVGMSYNPTTKVDFTKEKMLQSSNQYTEYNPKEATKLWKEGIKETGQKNLSFTLLGDDTDNSKKQNEYLQGQMEKNLPGIKITLSNVPFKSRLDKSKSGNFDIVVTGWNADYPDPVTFLDIFTTGNVQNNGKYSNAQYDALINKSKTTDATNEEARWQDLLQATKILTDEQGAIPLYQSYQANLTRSNVKGYQITPNGSYNLVTAYKK
ncbi:oligopeptide ABC transporter, substrate-binding lipoprotein precursor [Companilactobacillus paralimentarius DSM 13238 = JCM 10415]|uniref:Oligopeptide ABC transporter, substrate-binding lipoprotein n=1 Tax=Companilactobacillus paralimentarius DSM 13238 = JCM 10415 TaxID=1122151 RepID=A0A0R1PUH0_9LACO|nr:peptide ABC transporter substrate-binding protein [Companilactobacillus paralimentarius]KAE9564483.1 peptide ABC transporter substrate-binding protein [Companilactobacillus paralimentarius]KRL31992.1 oligopeptide ABC transporter, substrate-binding lipoprotein precursor [Companilactobacillus paralimentarius DSM 13238 = JCM 10415]MDR4932721.1 peptide ABC transporter substrate-binding protein [Companilactobacillus paralimentarius]QFR69281.1 peptide ABC transporter substrate-binding protein [Com